jgi:hypothetical protein
MPTILAFTAVSAAALYLLGFGGVCLAAPGAASRFLQAFAGSPRAHYLELFARFLVGAAFILRAPAMSHPTVVTVAGWVLLGTTAVLAGLPWTWHRRIAERAVPQAIRRIRLVGVAALAAGGAIGASLLSGAAA